ncbi:hypothetical protein GCM10010214_29520 [Streptomyces abikoensis]|nr:hypothetical protein GCM10010214_29520 [Streptomyces abikoensis]
MAASSIARAAMPPAIRIFSMVSASWTSGPSYGVGAGFPTYSGRRIEAGTGRVGESLPGTRSDWPDMSASVVAMEHTLEES